MGKIRQDRIARYVALIADEAGTMEELCQRLLEEWTLEQVCAAWGVPYSRLQSWIVAEPRRVEMVESAERMLAGRMARDTVLIADREGGENHQHAQARIRARQWLAGKYDRARFGDAVVVEHKGETVVRLSFGGRVLEQAVTPVDMVPVSVVPQLEDAGGDI
jgi:hypothetical protein